MNLIPWNALPVLQRHGAHAAAAAAQRRPGQSRRTWLTTSALALLSLAAGAAIATPTEAAADTAAIRQRLMAEFDKQDARLAVPVVVNGPSHGLAGWLQGERGGRALLRREHGQWRIVVCGGDALKEARVLREAGVPDAEARSLARDLAAAEARLSPAQRTQLASFTGTVRMDAQGQHPAGSAPGHHP